MNKIVRGANVNSRPERGRERDPAGDASLAGGGCLHGRSPGDAPPPIKRRRRTISERIAALEENIAALKKKIAARKKKIAKLRNSPPKRQAERKAKKLTPEQRSELLAQRLSDPAVRLKMRAGIKKSWADPAKRAARLAWRQDPARVAACRENQRAAQLERWRRIKEIP